MLIFFASLLTSCQQETINPYCSTAPTYDDWTKGFLDGKCQSCHASSTPNRHNAPSDITFDGENEAIYWIEKIEETVFFEESMPPSGGVTDDEKMLLMEWMDCNRP